MIAVVSQAWTLDGASALEGYLAEYRRFLEFHRRSAGFRGRQLLVGIEDPTHVTNIRTFDRVDDYEGLIALPGYGDHIDALSTFLDLDRRPVKEYVRVAVVDGPA